MFRNKGISIIFLGFLLPLVGCVSVNLPKMEGKRATEVRFQDPPAPFTVLNSPAADRAWISQTTGNTISFVSDCGARIDPDLNTLLEDSISALDNPRTSNRVSLNYNARSALSSEADGTVDGISVRLKLLVFKRNDCNYTLSYTSTPAAFASEVQLFDRFTEGFQAP